MSTSFIVILNALLYIITEATFDHIPAELVHNAISFSHPSDLLRLAAISRKYKTEVLAITPQRTIYDIIASISNLNGSNANHSLPYIESKVIKLRLNLMYSSHVAFILYQTRQRYNQSHISNQTLIQLLSALHMLPFDICSLPPKHSEITSFWLTFILGSRSLMYYYFPEIQSWNFSPCSDHQWLQYPHFMYSVQVHSAEIKHSQIAFILWCSYVYEYWFDHPSQRSLLPELDQLNNGNYSAFFKLLMEDYGFIPWTRAQIHKMRKRILQTDIANVWRLWLPLCRLDVLYIAPILNTTERLKFATNMILDVGQRAIQRNDAKRDLDFAEFTGYIKRLAINNYHLQLFDNGRKMLELLTLPQFFDDWHLMNMIADLMDDKDCVLFVTECLCEQRTDWEIPFLFYYKSGESYQALTSLLSQYGIYPKQ
eukprot:164118_1